MSNVISIGTKTEDGVVSFKRSHETRESWLNAAVLLFVPLFEEVGAPIPGKVRVSVGFCSTGRKSSRIGECWSDTASADGHHEIFLKPELPDAIRALDVLAHELVHAAVGVKHGHKRPFKRIALAIGLTGRMRSTVAGPALAAKQSPVDAPTDRRRRHPGKAKPYPLARLPLCDPG